MMSSGYDIVEALTVAYNLDKRLLLLFDYDGTLTPIASHPDLAELHPTAKQILKKLSNLPRVAVGIISGREIDDLESIVGLNGIYYAGTSGLELDLCGTQITHPNAGRLAILMANLRGPLSKILKIFPGVWLEDKQLGLTVHYRDIQTDQIPNLKAWIERVATPFKDKLQFNDGPMAVEITPNAGWNKATAVKFILEHFGHEKTLILYVGDATNDVDAFQYVASIGGISIGIGLETSEYVMCQLADQNTFSELLVSIDTAISRISHAKIKRKHHLLESKSNKT